MTPLPAPAGRLTALVTFPGLFVRAFAQHLVCRRLGLRVFAASYLSWRGLGAPLQHEPPDTLGEALALAVAPWAANSFLGVTLGLAAAAPLWVFSSAGPREFLLAWGALATGVHALPAGPQAALLRDHVAALRERKERPRLFRAVDAGLGVAAGWAGPWIGLLYAGLVGGALPLLVIRGLAVLPGGAAW